MLMCCLWVAYACLQVSLMVSSTFLMQLPQGILLVFYGFCWQGHFLRCVTSMCSLCVSFSQTLYLFSGLASVHRCPNSCCIYLLCVAHELRTSALWCSCSLPGLLHGIPTGCAMWPLCIPAGLMHISLGLFTDSMWKSSGCPPHCLPACCDPHVYFLCVFLWNPYRFPMTSLWHCQGFNVGFSIHFMLLPDEC